MRAWFVAAFFIVLGLISSAHAQTVTEYRIPNPIEQPHGITAGPDGNIWFVGNREVGRVTPDGVITEFKFPVQGPENVPTTGFGQHIVTGADGNMWFTGTNVADNIVRVTPQGAMTQFALSANARPMGITLGPDGNIWFAESGSNKIGRITPQGVITEFSFDPALGRPNGITAGMDGNLWFTVANGSGNYLGSITPQGVIGIYTIPIEGNGPNGIAVDSAGNIWFTVAPTKIGRRSPGGTFSEFSLGSFTQQISPEEITAGPDGNMWFTEFTGNKIGRIDSNGAISEFVVPTEGAGPQGITAGPDGNIWFTEGASGNRIGKIQLTEAGIRAGPVFSSTQPAGRSLLRFHNRSTLSGNVTVKLSSPVSGAGLATWTSPAIAPNAELEFDVTTIENSSTFNAAKPGYYELTITSTMAGYFRHVFSRQNDQSITNLTACTTGVTTPKKELAGVHSSVFFGPQSSSVVVHNTGLAAKSIVLGIYDARSGVKRGTYTTPIIQPNASVSISGADIDSVLGKPSDLGMIRYVVKAETSFAGYLQHLISNAATGFVGDMTVACDLSPAGNLRTDYVSYKTPTPISGPYGIAAGLDGNIWFTESTGSAVGRLTPGGSIAEFKLPASSGGAYGLDIAQGPDGKMWFVTSSAFGKITTTGAMEFPTLSESASFNKFTAIDSKGALWASSSSANAIYRVLQDGKVSKFSLPNALSVPQGIAAGSNGYLWFAEANKNNIGRVDEFGSIVEYPVGMTTNDVAIGPNGKIWATAFNAILAVTPEGIVSRYNLLTQNPQAKGITRGIDSAMWFTESEANQIGTIDAVGNITEFKLPDNTNPEDIASAPSGDLWMTARGTNSVIQFTPSATGLHIAGVLSSKQTASQSFLRFYNSSSTSGIVTVVLADANTGSVLGTWGSPSISAGTEVQFGLSTVEAGAGILPGSAPDRYTLTIRAGFTGSFQHILWRPGDGTFANLTTCDAGATLDRSQVFAVHSSLFQNNYPAFVAVSNTGPSAMPVVLGIYSGSSGRKLGTYNAGVVQPHGELFLPVSAIEAGAGITAGELHYTIKSEGALLGLLQSFVNNLQAGFSIDMSTSCALPTM